MSWLSDFFRNLFGRKPPEPPSPAAPQPTEALRPTAPYIPVPPSAPAPDPAATDPYGRPIPPAPFGRDNYGTPFRSQAEADAWRAAVAARDAEQAKVATLLATERYNGPIPVSSLLPGEADFLTYVCSNYSLPGAANQADVWYAILSGSLAEINLAINQSDARKAGYNPASYPMDGRLRGLVDQVARGILKPVVTH